MAHGLVPGIGLPTADTEETHLFYKKPVAEVVSSSGPILLVRSVCFLEYDKPE